jgi:tripartite-type tricarboxylate transporter receptor subunit TctC
VRIIVPFPPGGSADAAARIVAEKTSEEWKQPVLVENKPGAGTTIAAAFVAGSAPDGYVLYLTGPISHAVSAALYKNLSYDAVSSFTAVARVATAPFILVVHPSVKANSVQELVELAKARPGALTYASSGSGAAPHLAAEMLASMTGTKFVHVPYKGTAPALVALLGGQVDFQIADVAAIPHIRAGKLRALAVTTAKRSTLVPEIPTVAEAGVPGFDVPSATGILAPAGTPREIIVKVNTAINQALATEEVRQRLNAQGFEPAPATPEEFGAFLASEVRKYAKLIRDAGVRLD